MTHKFLAGIRVLDLSRLLPGGYCTQLLADLGAEVVKVETPRIGDYARHAPETFGGEEMFRAVNRNKKSLALNYRNARGREVLLRLFTTADVVLEAFRPGLVTRWKIDYAAAQHVNAGVVYCSLSGYGQSGPYRDRAGHDLNYLAIAGILDQNGLADGPPIPPAVQIADMAGGMLAGMAILGALVARGRTGNGAYLDVAMLDAAVSWAAPILGALLLANGRPPARGQTPFTGGLPFYNAYETADGRYLTLAALEPPLWTTFCKVAGREDLITRQFDGAYVAEVAALFRSQTQAQWLDRFEGVEVCLEPVSAYDQTLRHPQVRHRGMLLDEESTPAMPHPRVGSPFHSEGPKALAVVPALGQHTHEILQGAGLDSGEIQDLAAAGVIKLA